MAKDETSAPAFLKRWSRRKQQSVQPDGAVLESELESLDKSAQASEQQVGDIDASQSAQSPESIAAEAPPQPIAEPTVLTDSDMPDLESLNKDSDYSPFLSEGVSKNLRNMALKKLFFSGKFAVRDGLDDYDDDFTRFEPLGDTVTADMKFHQRRKERERLAKLEEEESIKEEQLIQARGDSEVLEAQEQEEQLSDAAENREADESIENDAENHKDDSESQQEPLPRLADNTESVGDTSSVAGGGGKLHRAIPSVSHTVGDNQA